jgi:hypothetical protein
LFLDGWHIGTLYTYAPIAHVRDERDSESLNPLSRPNYQNKPGPLQGRKATIPESRNDRSYLLCRLRRGAVAHYCTYTFTKPPYASITDTICIYTTLMGGRCSEPSQRAARTRAIPEIILMQYSQCCTISAFTVLTALACSFRARRFEANTKRV